MYERLKKTLAACGATFEDVVMMRVYTTVGADRAKLREVRSRYISQPPPGSTALIVQGLASPDMLCEVEMIAVVGGKT
jgi:enamine deaminase RidA (YjgF/YER057c/UK114 family)